MVDYWRHAEADVDLLEQTETNKRKATHAQHSARHNGHLKYFVYLVDIKWSVKDQWQTN